MEKALIIRGSMIDDCAAARIIWRHTAAVKFQRAAMTTVIRPPKFSTALSIGADNLCARAALLRGASCFLK